MSITELNDVQKAKMVRALRNLQNAVNEIGELWESNDGSGETPYDEILEKNFPFPVSFFDIKCDVDNWVDNAIKELNK